MKINDISRGRTFQAKLSKLAKIEYKLKFHRFPKAYKKLMTELNECENDRVIITGIHSVTLAADRDVVRKNYKSVISAKFIEEHIDSMIYEALENAADKGILEKISETFIKHFPNKKEQIAKIATSDNLVGLNDIAIECNEHLR